MNNAVQPASLYNKAPVTTARYAVLDIGSNSVRLVIYDIVGAAFTSIYNEKVLAGLGRDLVATGRLSESGKAQTLAALERFRLILEAQNVSEILVGATAALRDASDAPDFIKTVKTQTGFVISPISGEEEARLSAMGLLAAMPGANGLAADLGGASLELMQVGDGAAKSATVGASVSLPLGPFSVLGKNLRDADYGSDLSDRLCSTLTTHGFPAINPKADQPLYLIGGAWRNLAAIHQARSHYPLKTLQNYHMQPDAARALCIWAAGEGCSDVFNWPDISRRRADTLPFAAVMLHTLIALLNPSQIIISATGLREGLIYDALPDMQRARDAMHDGCRDLAKGNLSRENFAAPLFEFLSPLQPAMSTAFDPVTDQRLRYAACLLAGMGKGRHPSYRAALVFEDILYAPISGFTHAMRAYLALALFRSLTSDNDTPNAAAISHLLGPTARRSAESLGLAIRLAVVASGRSPQLLSQFRPRLNDGTVSLDVQAEAQALITARVLHRLAKLNAALNPAS